MHHTYKRKQWICVLIVTVFALVTVLEPITAVAAETGSQETQAQEQEKVQEQQDQIAVQSQEGSEAPEALQEEEQGSESDELDYEESANSWRFDNGQLIEQEQPQVKTRSMRRARAAYTAWGKNSNGQFVNSAGFVINGAIRKGVDVSEHQGKINWAKVKASGIDFAIIRCGYSGNYTKQDDKYWQYNVSECERLGIPYGVYLYSYANTPDKARSEAQHTLRLLKGHKPSYPVYYDLEDKVVASAGNSAIVNMANIYCSTLESAGYKAGIYANKSWWTSKLNSSSLNKYEKWVAQWYTSCTYNGSYRLWQCTSDGSVSGISGRVDLNFEFQRSDTDTYMGGWRSSGGKYYFYDFKGNLLTSQWITYKNNDYYVGADGARVTGKQTIDDKVYYFGSDGLLLKNAWFQSDGKKYYIDSENQPVLNSWKTDSGKKYYLGADGAAVTGAVDLDGNTYYFGSDGALKTNCWVRIENEKLYVNSQGIVQRDLCDEVEVITPIIEKWTRVSSTTMKLTWKKTEAEADGYEVQYSRAADFAGNVDTVKITDVDTVSTTVKDLDKNKKYYVRIRSYIKSAGQVYYSQWVSYAGVKADKTAAISLVKKAGKTFELNSSAGQKTGQYDVVQGSCTDGTYAYYVLYNKSNSKCRILKSRLSDNATVKVSGVLNLNHGNDITYNSDLKKLVVAHYSGAPYRLSLVDPESLTVTSYQDVKIPESLEGASSSELAAIKGFSGVAYNSERHQYVVRINQSHNYLLLDENMEPVKYVAVSKAGNNLNQGIDANNDYIFDVQSKAGSYNTVIAYDWDGEYQYSTRIPTGYEMESLFHNGDKFYAAVYSSYYQTYYTTHYKTKKVKWKRVKVKWKKVRGKWKYKKQWKYKTKYVYKTVKYKVKWKKVRGKWRYKTKKKKVRVTYRVAHKRLVRNNYVYNLGKI